MSYSIQQLVNEAVREDREKKEQTSWHASKLGSCATGQYLERVGKEPDYDFDDRTLRVFSVGKMMEDWLIGQIEKTGSEYETQVRVELSDLGVTGYIDLLINGLVYEVKSKQSKAFWYMNRRGEGANDQHKMQTWVYLYAKQLPEGRIIYLSKDDLSVLEYPVYLNDKELENKVRDECKILNDALETGIAPKPPEMASWQAKYCRWHKQCLEIEKARTGQITSK